MYLLGGGPDCWDQGVIIRTRVRVRGEVEILVLRTEAAVLVRLQAGISELLSHNVLGNRLEGNIPGAGSLMVRLFDLEPGAEDPASWLPSEKVIH